MLCYSYKLHPVLYIRESWVNKINVSDSKVGSSKLLGSGPDPNFEPLHQLLLTQLSLIFSTGGSTYIGYRVWKETTPKVLKEGYYMMWTKKILWSKEFSLKSHAPISLYPLPYMWSHIPSVGDSHSIALSYFLVCFNWLCWANAIDHNPWSRGCMLGKRSRLQGVICYNSNSQTVTKLASVGKLESGL